MKIQCDVCNKDEAAVFCSADEAALCNGCDHRVHHANKLASKHHRFSLLHPSSSSTEIPRCDICQERRAFLFCREDRAILCRECDISIHTANELTKKHNRFLLTGVKLSSTSEVFPSGSTSTTITSTSATNIDRDLAASADSNNIKNMITAPKTKTTTPCAHTSTNSFATVLPSTVLPSKYCDHSGPTSGGSTSSISEYLMETLPGWQVEDFLVDPSPTTTHGNGFCKDEADLHPYLDANYFDNQSNSQGCVVSEDLSLWVPETPANPTYMFDGRKNGLNLKEFVKETPILSSKQVNRRRSDHGFTVPSISPPSNKRSRHNW